MATRDFGFNQRASGTANVTVALTGLEVGDIVTACADVETGGSDLNPVITTGAGSTATTGAWTLPAGQDNNNNSDFWARRVYYTTVTGAGDLNVQAALATGSWMGVAAHAESDVSGFDSEEYTRDTATPFNSGATTPAASAVSIGFATDWSGDATPTADTGWTTVGGGGTYVGVDIMGICRREFPSGNASAQFVSVDGDSYMHVSQMVLLVAAAGGAAISIVPIIQNYRNMRVM